MLNPVSNCAVWQIHYIFSGRKSITLANHHLVHPVTMICIVAAFCQMLKGPWVHTTWFRTRKQNITPLQIILHGVLVLRAPIPFLTNSMPHMLLYGALILNSHCFKTVHLFQGSKLTQNMHIQFICIPASSKNNLPVPKLSSDLCPVMYCWTLAAN